MRNYREANEALAKLAGLDKFERLLQTAAILTEALMQQGVKPIVVGGLSVEIYSLSGYSTEDIDFVLNGYEKAGEVFKQLGFQRIGRSWLHPVAGVSLDIPSNDLAGDYDKITELKVEDRIVYLIGLEDIILDRLRRAVHWSSGRDREWGYRLLLMYLEKIDLPYITSRFETESERQEFEYWFEEASEEKNET